MLINLKWPTWTPGGNLYFNHFYLMLLSQVCMYLVFFAACGPNQQICKVASWFPWFYSSGFLPPTDSSYSSPEIPGLSFQPLKHCCSLVFSPAPLIFLLYSSGSWALCSWDQLANLLPLHITAPQAQSFWFWRSGVRQRNLHVWTATLVILR